jgi:hypothetical protein
VGLKPSGPGATVGILGRASQKTAALAGDSQKTIQRSVNAQDRTFDQVTTGADFKFLFSAV